MAEVVRVATKTSSIKSRIFFLCQYERNPKTGEDLHFDETNILAGLNHRSIKQWAYIKHDADKYTEEDCPTWAKIGDPKPQHWHVACRCDRAVELSAFASWFGVPDNMVDVPKGAGAFLDCVGYLTHEDPKQQLLGKTRYQDDQVRANFNWREEVDRRQDRQRRTGRPLSLGEEMVSDVYEGRKTIKQCWEQDPVTASAYSSRLDKARERYLRAAPMPPSRVNYYITGQSGLGKSYLANALARALYPGLPDDEVYFEVGEGAAAFSGYDGQPIIIWHDKRAVDLLQLLGGRGNVFDVFNNQPTRRQQNRKYGAVTLINSVNIVESVQPWEEFLDGLAGEYTDKSGVKHLSERDEKVQSYRRFPIIIPIHIGDFDVLLNRGYLMDNADFLGYIQYHNVRASMREIAQTLGATSAAARQMTAQAVQPVAALHGKVSARLSSSGDEPDQATLARLAPVVSSPYHEEQARRVQLDKLGEELASRSADRVYDADEDTSEDVDNFPEVPEDMQAVLSAAQEAGPEKDEVRRALIGFFRYGCSTDSVLAALAKAKEG